MKSVKILPIPLPPLAPSQKKEKETVAAVAREALLLSKSPRSPPLSRECFRERKPRGNVHDERHVADEGDEAPVGTGDGGREGRRDFRRRSCDYVRAEWQVPRSRVPARIPTLARARARARMRETNGRSGEPWKNRRGAEGAGGRVAGRILSLCHALSRIIRSSLNTVDPPPSSLVGRNSSRVNPQMWESSRDEGGGGGGGKGGSKGTKENGPFGPVCIHDRNRG